MAQASPEDPDDYASGAESAGDDPHEVKTESGQASPSDLGGGKSAPAVNAAGTSQKRRRVTRACDECRRKKIKCDGKQPCTHCTVYSYGKLPGSNLTLGTRTGQPTDAYCRVHI